MKNLQNSIEEMWEENQRFVKRETSHDKVLFNFQQGQTVNRQTVNAISLILLPKRQISGYLSVSSSRKLYWLRSLLSYLARFIVSFAGCPYFCFVGSLIICFTIDETKSNSVDITVGLSGWSLWKILIIF